MEFSAVYHSDVGIRKKTNQDALGLKIIETPNGQVAFGIVCDGMGGLSKGELASKEVVISFCKWFDVEFTKEQFLNGFSKRKLESRWSKLIKENNDKLGKYGENNKIMLGTTVSAVLLYKDEYFIVHVGDSRIYEITDSAKQITVDQTFVEREVSAGRMSKEQALVDKRKNILLQCVGASKIVKPVFISGKIKRNSLFLICSDGFRHKISDEEMIEKVSGIEKNDDEIKQGCKALTELAKTRKETDNITVAVIRTK